MHGGGGALRAALAGASLLVLAAAGMHFKLLREPAWIENAGLLGRGSKAAAWAPWHPQLAVDNIGSRAPIRASMPGAGSGSHGQALHATLHLPDHTQLEVEEGTTLEELVSKLLAAQTGDRRSPSSIEVIAIERITIERPSRLHTVACALARALRLPVSWQGAVAAADSEDARSASLMDSLAGGVTVPAGTAARGHAALGAAAFAAARRQAALAAFGVDGAADEQVLPMGAFDDEYRDDVDEMEQPGRKLMLKAREREAGAPREEETWQPVKLFGPRMPALQQLQPVLPRGQKAQGRPPVLRVRVLVVLKQRVSRSQAPLLDELATPAQSLGRRAAAGADGSLASGSGRVQLQGPIREAVLAQLLDLQQQQWQQLQDPVSTGVLGVGSQTLLLAAVDAVFVGAVVVAVVCAALLGVDVARHGWRRRSASQQLCAEEQRALRAPFLVVAADEVAAWAAAAHKQ